MSRYLLLRRNPFIQQIFVESLCVAGTVLGLEHGYGETGKVCLNPDDLLMTELCKMPP